MSARKHPATSRGIPRTWTLAEISEVAACPHADNMSGTDRVEERRIWVATVARMQEQIDALLSERGGSVWVWQRDGGNELETLVCPVLIHADDLREILRRSERLLSAICEHHGQRADDRCQLDDAKLYVAAGLEPADVTMPPRDVFLANCARFYDRRCKAGNWPTYQELEATVAALQEELADAERGEEDSTAAFNAGFAACVAGEDYDNERAEEWCVGYSWAAYDSLSSSITQARERAESVANALLMVLQSNALPSRLRGAIEEVHRQIDGIARAGIRRG